MSKDTRRDSQQKPAPKRAAGLGKRRAAPATAYVREAELRQAADHDVLGGADLEHCQRMCG
jgi:hypothetical protein